MKHKPLARQLTAQFFRGNVPMFALAVFAALTGGTLNLIVTWLMQQLIDAASGLPGALPLGQLAWITGGFILLCAALMLLKYASEPRFIEKAMRQYKDFAFQKLTEKSISSFRAESTAAYLSALTNDAASIEADDLSQLLSVIMKAVTFFGALAMMLWYSPLMTAIAAGVTVLPLIPSVLTGGQLQAAEKYSGFGRYTKSANPRPVGNSLIGLKQHFIPWLGFNCHSEFLTNLFVWNKRSPGILFIAKISIIPAFDFIKILMILFCQPFHFLLCKTDIW